MWSIRVQIQGKTKSFLEPLALPVVGGNIFPNIINLAHKLLQTKVLDSVQRIVSRVIKFVSLYDQSNLLLNNLNRKSYTIQPALDNYSESNAPNKSICRSALSQVS